MNCKNCNNILEDNQNYCFECGAKHIRNRLKPKVLFKQVNEQFLSIDNKFLSTFIDLFRKPEQVINGYINGTRKKHIDVLQYIAIALTLVGIQVFLMNSFFSEELESSFDFLKSLEDNNLSGSPKNKKNPIQFNLSSFNEFNNYQSIIYIITIPFYAIASWMANLIIKPKFLYNFTEHLVINIYYYGQVIIISALLSILFLCFGLNYLFISGGVSLFTLVYLFYTLKRVFSLDFWNSIAYFSLVMVSFCIVLTIFLTLAFVIGLLYGYFN